MGLKRKGRLSYKVTAIFFFGTKKEKDNYFFMLKKGIQIDGFSKSELPIRKVASVSNQVVRHCRFLGSYNYHYFGPVLHANATPFALSFILLQRLLGRALDGGRELRADGLTIGL
jgi:hypothetical protein